MTPSWALLLMAVRIRGSHPTAYLVLTEILIIRREQELLLYRSRDHNDSLDKQSD